MRHWVQALVVVAILSSAAGIGLAAPTSPDRPAGGDEVPARVDPLPPRTLNESEVNCSTCHAYIPINTTPRTLNISLELLQVSPIRLNLTTESFRRLRETHPKRLDHGNFWCYECHSQTRLSMLELENGTELQFGPYNSSRICRQCHAKYYSDWKAHIHGKWVGSWKNPKPGKFCVDCHNPHDNTPPFHQIEVEPPPNRPPSNEVSRSLLPANYPLVIGIGLLGAVGLLGFAATRNRWW
ncbi:MAG: hypothetical protein ABEJ27_02540 [Halodesulfurarchaeum sp.]